MQGLLALEDGRTFTGTGFGADGVQTGELVFNTSMTGYQEILTDPSYHKQIVTMTVPQSATPGLIPKMSSWIASGCRVSSCGSYRRR